MQIQSWDVRGIERPEKMRRIKKSLLDKKVDIVLHQETKKPTVDFVLVRSMWPGDHFDFMGEDAIGRAGGLLCIWNPKGHGVWGVISVKSGVFQKELGAQEGIEE
ncbi:hypothetical protein CsSME_00037552 [Camellia sinensis var. sinensis]